MRKPTTLPKLAGLRNEPPRSLPSAIGSIPQASAEHGIQVAVLQQSIKTLEASLAEAAAREQALAAARQAEDAKWKADTDALRQSFAEAEQALKGVEQDRDEVIARYDTDRASWEQRAATAEQWAGVLAVGWKRAGV